ncbi:MAG: hypothetical protein WC565_08025 [Parcubacteria group bacterium]
MSQILRTVRFSPYGKTGTKFSLTMWDTGRYDSRGQTIIRYWLTMREPDSAFRRSTVLFQGDNFAGSPMHADDSDATVASLMGFLTLRPGDTDPEYFADYTEEQREFCDQHAEALQLCCLERFGEV